METGPFYSIYTLADSARSILSLIDKFRFDYFLDENVIFTRRDIESSISVAKSVRSINDKVLVTAHPGIHSAIKGINFYEKKKVAEDSRDNKAISRVLYNDLVFIIFGLGNLIGQHFQDRIEIKLVDLNYVESIKMLTIERQNDRYVQTHPSQFVIKYREYLNKRIQDFNELLELDKLDLGIELKDIIESYKLGLEVNVHGRNLLTPLIKKDYSTFIENLRNALFIPSYYDSEKKEKEKYFHIYLLGLLEGRLNLYNIKSNRESGHGRYDICCFPVNKKNPGLIIEVKSDNTKVETAIAQIKENEYINDLKVEGVHDVLALGINFMDKDIKIAYEELKS